MFQVRPLLTVALVLALTPAVAFAQDGEPDEKNKHLYTLTSAVKNLPQGGAVFELEGTAKNFPDGTLLHVSLNLKAAASQKPVEAAFFMVRVDKERFKARKVYKHQKFAPLQYWAQADLILSSQRKAVRDWIRRELGLPKEARLVLARKMMRIGTKAEEAAFKQKTLLDLKAFVLGFQKDCKALHTFSQKPKTEYADYDKKIAAFTKTMITSTRAFSSYLDKYVTWHEDQLLKGIKGSTAEMGWSIRMHGRRYGKARRALTRIDQVFKILLNGINARLPKQEDGDGEKDNESDKPDESKNSGS